MTEDAEFHLGQIRREIERVVKNKKTAQYTLYGFRARIKDNCVDEFSHQVMNEIHDQLDSDGYLVSQWMLISPDGWDTFYQAANFILYILLDEKLKSDAEKAGIKF